MIHSVKAGDAIIPAIGLGTWELRGEKCAAIVTEALKVGYRHIDTAAMYKNEEAVGAGLIASGVPRDNIFLTTKVWLDDLGPGALQASAEASLRRLGVEDVDLLLVHWPHTGMSVKDMIEPLVDARERGLTRHIGVSNFTSMLLREANAVADGTLVANQCEYHPYLNQDVVISACRTLKMGFTSYCPLARGGALFDEAAIVSAAERHGKTAAQIILRWHIQQEDMIAIPRTSKPERVSENIDVADFSLSDDDMTAISALTARHHRICDYGFSPIWDAA
ncbi:MAG: aldo/keto reductase [Pseudomonadota bacterium]